jgi:E3 ubiquitin-protein ligase HERC3
VCIVEVSAGGSHSLALSDRGAVYAWGSNAHGQLGVGDLQCRRQPVIVAGLRMVTVKQLSAGSAHCLAVGADGRCFSWGCAGGGRLGVGLGPLSHAPCVTSPEIVAPLAFGPLSDDLRRRFAVDERVGSVPVAPVVQASAGGAHSLVW